jgi:F-type H+-transporting ATPase subunit alpha
MVEVLKQSQYSPMPVEEQVMILYAATRGFMDDVAVAQVRDFEKKFLEYLRASKPDILAGIRNIGTLSEPEVLSEAITAFKKSWG